MTRCSRSIFFSVGFISYWHRTRQLGYFHSSCWRYLHLCTPTRTRSFTRECMQVLSSHTDTYTQVYTYVCTLLSMDVYHRAIPFSFQNVFFFYILYIVYWDCRWVHKIIMKQIHMQVGYWAEVRFHRMKYLTNQMMNPKMPFATQTLIFRFKHDLTLAQLFASIS